MGEGKRKWVDEDAGSSSDAEAQASPVKTNAEGEQYWDLGSKKRITVRSWKGSTLIDIREFYGEGDDLKPGKKGTDPINRFDAYSLLGISLNMEQFKVLASAMPELTKIIESKK